MLWIWHSRCVDYNTVLFDTPRCFFLKLLPLYNSLSVFLHEVWCTSVSHRFPFRWKIVWTLALLSSLIFWNSWELYSPAWFLCLLWLDITKLWWLCFLGLFFFFFPFVSKIPFWGLPEPSLLWTSFVICDTSFRTMWRRVKLHYLFHHEKLSVISVLLLLGSSPTLCILVPRGQDACMICGPYNMPIILSTVF